MTRNREKGKRKKVRGWPLFLSILLFTFSFSFSACDFKVPKDPQVLVEHMGSDPVVLNPIISNDYNSSKVDSYIFETLIDLDNETLEYKPLLATDWTSSNDHLQFTFHLRKDVKWHDGVPFTAADVVYSYNMIQDPKVDAAVMRVYVQDVKSVEALDDHTVRFIYKKPYFRALLVCGSLPIVPKHVFEGGPDFNKHPSNRHPIGTGPYIFKEWKTKQKIVLARNEAYWKGRPKIEGMVFKIIEDSTVPFQLLKKRELDMLELRSIQWERETGTRAFEENFNKVKYYLPSYSYIGWNQRKPFFQDRRVRHAMSMLINKKEILDKLLFGNAVMIEGPIYYFSSAYDHSVVPDPYDPKRAAELLDEAGWMDHDGDGVRDKDGVKFKFDLYYGAGGAFAGQLGTMMREDLGKVGIVMGLRGLEGNALFKALDERQFDASLLAWSMPPVDSDPYQIWHSSQTEEGSNYIGFMNADADRLIDAIRVEFDKNKRDELYRRLQRLLHDEQPYTFLYNPATMLAYDKRFTNVKVYRVGVDTREWDIKGRE